MITILAACVAMGFMDSSAALRNIAESRGQATRAGLLDMIGGLAGTFSVVFGAGTVITQGLTVTSVGVIVGMAVTDFLATSIATRYGSKVAGNRR